MKGESGKFILLAFCAASLAWLDPYRDRVSKGNSEFHGKRYNEARKSYKDAEKYAPAVKDTQQLSFNKGDADYMLEDYENAITNFQNAIQSGDKDVQKKAFLNIGNTYVKQKKYKEAIQAYINALKIDPDYAAAKENLEYLLRDKKDQKDKNDQDKDKKDKGDDKNKQDRNKEGQDKKNKQDQKKNQQKEKRQLKGGMSREQIRNILQSMQHKPVRRKKENTDERPQLEKNW